MTKKQTTKKKTDAKPTIWETLSVINVNDHTEKKGRFTYLSWAWAWGILMEHYPDATFENHLNADGYPCFFDDNGYGMVRVTLCIEGKCHSEDFMITNNSNQAIKNPNSMDVNTALKRCLVKSMAYFGLGHYIYAGEDLPNSSETKEEEAKEAPDRQAMLSLIGTFVAFDAPEGWEKTVLGYYSEQEGSEATEIAGLSDSQLVQIVERINEKLDKKAGI